MKKKLISTVLGISLVFGTVFAASPALASSVQTNQVSASAEVGVESVTRYITVQRSYAVGTNFPSTISYNSGGYSGTLRVVGSIIQHQGYWVVTYGGNVSCHGTCPIF